MRLISNSFKNGELIPGEFAFCIPNDRGHVCLGSNRNPHLAWDDVPAGTQSFAIICHDPDVPSKPDDVNQEGKTVPASLPRIDFFHWVLVDIPKDVREIPAGKLSSEVSPKGKSGPDTPIGGAHGINDYTVWFSGDAEMKGNYFGYDGPCPPWNDSIWHHYIFTIYALDTPSLALARIFDGKTALAALQRHILGSAQIMGRYTLNPELG